MLAAAMQRRRAWLCTCAARRPSPRCKPSAWTLMPSAKPPWDRTHSTRGWVAAAACTCMEPAGMQGMLEHACAAQPHVQVATAPDLWVAC